MYKQLVFPVLKLLDPEKAHYLAMDLLRFANRIPFLRNYLIKTFTVEKPILAKTVFGLHFNNPVGLAAGFDKNAQWVDALSTLGFGFIEIGTVTPKPQPGNEAPRLFRLAEDYALINRMGFNNGGSKLAAHNLRNRKSNILIGGNIGKNKSTSNENATQDYLDAFEDLYDWVDYFVVNVSSPNTPGLRELQEKEPLSRLLLSIKAKNESKSKPKPLLLKIAPDLNETQLDDIIEIAQNIPLDGIIATNTTISREQLKASRLEIEGIGAGGLSGKPLQKRSTEVISYIHSKCSLPIIAVGGIFTAEDVKEKLDAGASLVQIYTGFIYEGPEMVKNILRQL